MADDCDGSRQGEARFVELIPNVSRETLDRLRVYETLVKQWQPAVNLVSPNTLERIWTRHFADSAQLFPLAPEAATHWVDLGSGAGFPGLVLAILVAGRPNARVTLVESDQRKAAFLREAARRTEAPALVLAERTEKAATQFMVRKADVVTARALAGFPHLLDLAAPFFDETTAGLFLKGRGAEREVQEARRHWTFEAGFTRSLTDAEGRIVSIRGLRAKQGGERRHG